MTIKHLLDGLIGGIKTVQDNGTPVAIRDTINITGSAAVTVDGDSINIDMQTSTTALAAPAESYADLRSATGLNGQIKFVKGRVVPGDGGEGLFRWSTQVADDDGGTSFNQGGLGSSSAGWRRVGSDALSARWFGAVGDGVTDDHDALDLALGAANAAGKLLFIPPGNYLLNSQLDFGFMSNVHVRGEPGSQITLNVADIGIGGNGTNGCTLENLTLSGLSSRPLAFSSAARLTIKGCRITSGANLDANSHEPAGIWISGSTDCVIEGCNVSGCGRLKTFTADATSNTFTSASHGFLLNDQVHVYAVGAGSLPTGLTTGTLYYVVNPTGSTFQLAASAGGSAIDISTAGSGTLKATLISFDIFGDFSGHTRLSVRGNVCTSTDTICGIGVENAVDSDISGNLVSGTGGARLNDGYGILVSETTTSERVAVVGNVVRGTSGSGIYFRGSQLCTAVGNVVTNCCLTQLDASLNVGGIAGTNGPHTVTGNVVEDSGSSGISFSSSGIGPTIVGNHIRGAAIHGIWLRGTASNANVSNNTIVSPGSRGIFADSEDVNVVCNGNLVISTGNSGIEFTGGLAGVIDGNMVYNSGFAGIVAITHSDGLIISNNRVHICADIGIYADITQGSIVGNRVSEATRNGIFCSGADTRIAGNRVTGCTAVGLRSTGHRCDISENNLIDNDVDGYDIGGVNTCIRHNRLTTDPIDGVAGLASGTVTVSTSGIEDGDIVRLTRLTPGSAQGHLSLGAITDGTSFVINSSNGSDNGTVRWEIEKPRPWSADLVGGNTFLLRASSNPAADANQIASWLDEGSIGADFVQATGGKQPTKYVTGGPKNGARIRFGGGGTVLECAGDPFGALTASHAFVVMKVDADPAVSNAGAWKFGSAGTDPQVPYSDGHIYDDWGSTTRKDFGDPSPSMASWCVYEIISTSSEKTALVNGVQVGTDATNTVDFATTCRIGAADAGATNFMVGDIAEIFQADHKLTASERAEYALHIAREYGISI